MNVVSGTIQWAQRLVARPPILAIILFIDIAAYFAGLLYWYGVVMSSPFTPVWAWPFIPDCPLFGLLGGLGLMMVVAQREWSRQAQSSAQRWLLAVGGVFTLFWLVGYLPGIPALWRQLGAMFAVFGGSLLLVGAFFRKSPVWLLSLIAFGQIKYGLWTITAWLLFWRSTAQVFGSPLFTPDSVLMTITHIGLVAQGIFLLTYFRPDVKAALICLFWFGLSDFVDYGLGWYPAIPLQFIPLSVMQWSTIVVTIVLSATFLFIGMSSQRVDSATRLAARQS